MPYTMPENPDVAAAYQVASVADAMDLCRDRLQEAKRTMPELEEEVRLAFLYHIDILNAFMTRHLKTPI